MLGLGVEQNILCYYYMRKLYERITKLLQRVRYFWVLNGIQQSESKLDQKSPRSKFIFTYISQLTRIHFIDEHFAICSQPVNFSPWTGIQPQDIEIRILFTELAR